MRAVLVACVVVATGCDVLFPLNPVDAPRNDAAPFDAPPVTLDGPVDAAVDLPTITLVFTDDPIFANKVTDIAVSIEGTPGATVYYGFTAAFGSPSSVISSVVLSNGGSATVHIPWTPPDDYIKADMTMTVAYDPNLTPSNSLPFAPLVNKQFGHATLANSSLGNLTKNTILAIPVSIATHPAHMVELAIKVRGSVDCNGMLALYTDSPGGPKTRFGMIGNIQITATTATISAAVDFNRAMGKYWIAFVADDDVQITKNGTAEGAVTNATTNAFALPGTFPAGNTASTESWAMTVTVGPQVP